MKGNQTQGQWNPNEDVVALRNKICLFPPFPFPSILESTQPPPPPAQRFGTITSSKLVLSKHVVWKFTISQLTNSFKTTLNWIIYVTFKTETTWTNYLYFLYKQCWVKTKLSWSCYEMYVCFAHLALAVSVNTFHIQFYFYFEANM